MKYLITILTVLTFIHVAVAAPGTNALLFWNGTNFQSTTSPTVGWITATSTTATSTFMGGLKLVGKDLGFAQGGLEWVHGGNYLETWAGGDGCNDIAFLASVDNRAARIFRVDGCGIDVIGNIGVTSGDIDVTGTVHADTNITTDGTVVGNLISTTGGEVQLFTDGHLEAANSQFQVDTAGSIISLSTATSSFTAPLSFTRASTTATSTMAGINLLTGCFAINGTCVGGGGVEVTHGYVLQAYHHTSSMADSVTLYWGSGWTLPPTVTAHIWQIYVPKTGTIKMVDYLTRNNTGGSGEFVELYISVNNATDHLIFNDFTMASTTNHMASTTVSIAVTQGDFIEVKQIHPVWATNPGTGQGKLVIYIEE